VSESAAPALAAPAPPSGFVIRSAGLLFAAQVLATPLSALISVIAARKLGPDDFGRLYLAMTYGSFASLWVEWGQNGTLAAMIARNRGQAGEVLGSALAWRVCALPCVTLVLFAGCWVLGYDAGFLRVLALVLLGSAAATVSGACIDVFRGCERSDLSAASYLAWAALSALIVVPTLLLGGGLDAMLLAQAACAAVGALVLLRSLEPVGVPAVSVSKATVRALVAGGTSFLVLNLILALQTNIDAVFLSKLAPADVVGWNAAARKVTGLLIFPASALIGALYPTLCRLQGRDGSGFATTARDALRVAMMAAVPVALGCALFPQLGIALFGGAAYGPAQDNLRVLAVYVLLVYLTMPLGTILAAAGRQRAWAGAQFACVAVSAACDPLLIPWFQDRTGNGGLGVCVSTAGSEVLMVAAGLWLLPRGVLDGSLGRTLASVACGGAAMAVIAWAASWVSLGPVSPWATSPWAIAPMAVMGYAACLWSTGALPRSVFQSALERRQRR
jgi:O-antigen/teichoic acid export membrane protein